MWRNVTADGFKLICQFPLPVRVRASGLSATSRGVGARWNLAEITRGDSLVMHLTLSPDDAPLTIETASVRRCNEYLFSIAFLVMDTKEQERLHLYLLRLEQREQPMDAL
jgi:hypothetical protein